MKQEKRFENVNFSQVPSRSSDRRGKRSILPKFIWLALIVTKVIMLVVIPGGIVIYKTYGQKHGKKEVLQNKTFTSKANVNCFKNAIKIFNTDQWTLEKKDLGNLTSELPYCKESDNSLESIPSAYSNFINSTQCISSSNFKTFLNIDILLIFDSLINKYGVSSLKSVFAEHHKKLSSIESKEDFRRYLNSLESNKIKIHMARMEMYGWDFQLSDFRNVFSMVKELNYWYQYLDGLEEYLASYERQKRRQIYRKTVTEQNFNFFLRENKENISWGKYYDFGVTKKKLQEVNEVISAWTKDTTTQKNKTILTICNRVLLISEVKDKLKNDSTHPNVYVFASRILILDEDLELPGVNIALIAPVWIFFRKIIVNLNGLNGSKNGRPGEPGLPGGHGGDFLGVGDAKFEFLNVSNRGGNGGPGQDGEAGLDGENFTLPDFSNTPKCLLEMKSSDGEFNPGATYYKVFNKAGCGKEGMDGGVGGLGGKGGKILMINKLKEKFGKGLDGTLGIFGKGGKGGSGSAKGCYYKAAAIDNDLFPVTRVICSNDTVLPSGKPGNDNANSQNRSQPSEKISLNFSDPILKFYKFAVANLENNDVLRSFLTDQLMWKQTLIYVDLVKKFRTIDNFKNLKFYEFFQQEIHMFSKSNSSKILNFLMALTKGKILTVKHKVGYSFLDVNNYLSAIQQNIENIKHEPTGKYEVSLLKSKLDDKLHRINLNLKNLRGKLQRLKESNHDSIERLLEKSKEIIDTDDLVNSLHEQRSVGILEIVVEIAAAYVKKISSHGEDVRFKNFVSRQILTFEKSETKKRELLNSFGEFSPNETQILSQFIESETQIKKYKVALRKIINLPDFSGEERKLWDAVGKVSVNGLKQEERKETVENLMSAVSAFGDSFDLRPELKFLFEEFIENLRRFTDLDKLLEWCESEEEFKKSLDNLPLETDDLRNEVDDVLKNELNNVIVEIYYKSAVDALEQKVWPLLQPTRFILPTNNRTVAEEALFQIQILRQVIKSTKFCRNKHQASFYANSTVGEFYFWPSERIQLKVKELFQGLPIDLKADTDNHHFLDKNLVRMKTLRLEFACREYENSQDCENGFFNDITHFKIELTHSGYSLFNWKGATFTIVSDELTLDYSLKIEKNGEPEFYNTIFKRLENCEATISLMLANDSLTTTKHEETKPDINYHGEINISPFTTWKIQLKPINPLADFAKLMPFANRIDLRLIGIGTFYT